MKKLQVVFENEKIKIVYIGKRRATIEGERMWDCIFVCLMRDFMGRKWSSGKIYIPKELVEDTGFNYLDLVIELSEERKHMGIKYHCLNEN